jgi:hypothetical protein
MFIARDQNKKIFAPLGAKARRLAAKEFKYVLSYKRTYAARAKNKSDPRSCTKYLLVRVISRDFVDRPH